MVYFLILILGAAAAVLLVLSVIDLRIRLLPNVWNAALAGLAVVFHGMGGFAVLSPFDMAMGAAMGGGLLWVIRFGANWYYGQDALGLGDVKLMAAAGLWLGGHDVLSALIVGALAGIVHGGGVLIAHKIKHTMMPPLSHFSIPAGPGFCFGIFAIGAWVYAPFISGMF
ncbi:MAG: prepilin peptidase [Alphaproteobacteria bacterium]